MQSRRASGKCDGNGRCWRVVLRHRAPLAPYPKRECMSSSSSPLSSSSKTLLFLFHWRPGHYAATAGLLAVWTTKSNFMGVDTSGVRAAHAHSLAEGRQVVRGYRGAWRGLPVRGPSPPPPRRSAKHPQQPQAPLLIPYSA